MAPDISNIEAVEQGLDSIQLALDGEAFRRIAFVEFLDFVEFPFNLRLRSLEAVLASSNRAETASLDKVPWRRSCPNSL